MLMPLYFSLIFDISGCSACILRIDLRFGDPEREQREVDDNRQQHDRPAVVVHELIVHPVQNQKQRLGDYAEPSPVDYAVEFGIHGCSRFTSLGPT